MADTYQWRACVGDRGMPMEDWSQPYDSREAAEGALPHLMNAEPPYEEAWIERRPSPAPWERVTDKVALDG